MKICAFVETYVIDIILPNNVIIQNVIGSCSNLGDDIDMLIGMDIIRHGDFSITNKYGGTTFSFRIPSIKEIDYAEEYKLKKSQTKNETNA